MSSSAIRETRGRPRGSLSRVTSMAREAALKTGLLPHEWLLKVARGEPIMHKRHIIKFDGRGRERGREVVEEEVFVDFATRLDAAKAAAPFYAAKLQPQPAEVAAEQLSDGLRAIAAKLPV